MASKSVERRYVKSAGIALIGAVIVAAVTLNGGSLSEPGEGGGSALGIYGSSWMPWLRENSSNIDFLIYQVGPSRPVSRVVEDLRAASDSGIGILLTVKVRFPDPSSRETPTLDESLQPFTRILDEIRDVTLFGITIGEENIHWDGHATLLAAWYEELKRRYPGRRFFQWYSPARKLNVPGERWPDLPADGWVFDQYPMTPQNYRRYVNGMARLDKPLISVIWASPYWRPGEKRAESSPQWWNEHGWRQFHEKLRVNLERQIPTALFPYDLKASDSKQPLPLYRSERDCARRFLDDLAETTLPYLQGVSSLPPAPESRPDWIPAGC